MKTKNLLSLLSAASFLFAINSAYAQTPVWTPGTGGIGTTNPLQKLEVLKPATNGTPTIKNQLQTL